MPFRILLLVIFFYYAFSSSAYAYLDPGTGSYMLQLLVAGLASALLAVKVFWNNIVSFFRKLFKSGKKAGK